MSHDKSLRLIILMAIGFFCLDNINYTPPLPEPEPVVVEVKKDDTRERLTERTLWLVQESMAYALHKSTRISGNEARVIVSQVSYHASLYDIDDSLVLGLIVAESFGNDEAISPVGARGLMQIMPATGQFIAASFSEKWEGRRSLYQVERNIRYGVWYLNHLREQFPDNEQAMVAAYNWGPDNVQRRLRKGHALPKVYPGKVWTAQKRIQETMYEFYQEHYWRSLDLNRDPPFFEDDTSEPPHRTRSAELLVYDGEGGTVREGRSLQQVSRVFPGRDRSVSRRQPNAGGPANGQ